MDFPFFNTRTLSDSKKYDLADPAERRAYFESKLGSKIDDLKQFLDVNTFVGFMLAKKGAGKGTYSKMFAEIVGEGRVAHISVGDVVREAHTKVAQDPDYKIELCSYLASSYRGFMSPDECVDALVTRSQEKLISTEFILALVKREIEKVGRKAVFIDGFPRSEDQISYSLYFRELINFRDDPDFFVLIDIPESIIDARMRSRLVCPACKTSRNLKLLPTKFPKYDSETKEFYLLCDNSSCVGYNKTRLVAKEGDDKGIEPIRARLEQDARLVEMASRLQGVPKVLVRNAVPVDKVQELVEEYELTPEYTYLLDQNTKQVLVNEKPWTIKDDSGNECHSLLAPAAVVSMVSQLHAILFPTEL